MKTLPIDGKINWEVTGIEDTNSWEFRGIKIEIRLLNWELNRQIMHISDCKDREMRIAVVFHDGV